MMSDIHIRISGRIGRITLQRAHALNALTPQMAIAVEEALDAWADDDAVSLVLIDAQGEKAFCAGGDIAALYHHGLRADYALARAFWRQEYRMNARIAEYPKPVVALMHGFVLGGGVGLGCHAHHRILAETAQVAMPECGIGLIPDVGGTWLLGRAPGRLGEYLALTSGRMGVADALYCGFADAHVQGAHWPAVIAALEESGDVGVIARYHSPAGEAPLAALSDRIEQAFAAPDVGSILNELSAIEGPEAEKARSVIARNAPLAMAATLALIRAARADLAGGLRAALVREYRYCHRAIAQGDFLEGIRAQIIDKDRQPRWSTDAPGGVAADELALMLAPLGLEELNFGARS